MFVCLLSVYVPSEFCYWFGSMRRAIYLNLVSNMITRICSFDNRTFVGKIWNLKWKIMLSSYSEKLTKFFKFTNMKYIYHSFLKIWLVNLVKQIPDKFHPKDKEYFGIVMFVTQMCFRPTTRNSINQVNCLTKVDVNDLGNNAGKQTK